MPSPVRKHGRKRIYKRKGSRGSRSGRRGYSLHQPRLDRTKQATTASQRLVKRYPQAYDAPNYAAGEFILVHSHKRRGRIVRQHRRRRRRR